VAICDGGTFAVSTRMLLILMWASISSARRCRSSPSSTSRHCGKNLFAGHADEFRAAHYRMIRCYAAGAPRLEPPLQRLTFPYHGVEIPGWLRKPRGSARPPVAILLPGLDGCKEKLPAWAAAFAARGVAALTIEGPGQLCAALADRPALLRHPLLRDAQ
jgi:hypothetical protein